MKLLVIFLFWHRREKSLAEVSKLFCEIKSCRFGAKEISAHVIWEEEFCARHWLCRSCAIPRPANVDTEGKKTRSVFEMWSPSKLMNAIDRIISAAPCGRRWRCKRKTKIKSCPTQTPPTISVCEILIEFSFRK